MFQLPPGMNYKQFQAAGSPGYRSDALPFQEGGYTNAAGGSVRQSSRYGNAQPMQPQGRGTPYPGGPARMLAPGTAPGTSDAPWYDAPFAVLKRYDQAQPMQPQGRGTPYPGGPLGALAPDAAPGTRDTPGPGGHWYGPAGPSPQQPFDQNRWMQQEIDRYKKRYEEKQRNDSLTQQLDYWKNMFGGQGTSAQKPQQPWSGSPMGGPLDNGYQSFGGGQYTNGQGQGFMGSMSFAPGTPASYQNQAYGNWANSQGYFQPPTPGTPYGAYKPHPPPHDPLKKQAWGRAAAGLAPGMWKY
jgi:hypothetical protein